ncbi:hypothetical protein GOP47_0023293 [Adiantum capillus-veneris]|uniref:Uncharacterized protein n=1 Tax=Adiantum capillus-veneris TaxID=13818 RepID=A0A9D4Z651_ADICA|nr:hypothetical protein GOP47_0023293 [Adiantum capillus-veneris]
MWLKRWSTTSPQEEHALLKMQPKQERGIVNSRHFVENNYSSSQSSLEYSHQFDVRPAKRACYGQRFGLHSKPCQGIPGLGSIGIGRQSQQQIDATSHFMKRFLAPSGAAMAVMGKTARKAHGTHPQRRGLFSAWPAISSENKALKGQVKAGKEFLTRHTSRKEFLHSSVKPSSTQVDA